MSVIVIVEQVLEALFSPLVEGTSYIANAIKEIFTNMLFDGTVVEGTMEYELNAFGATILIFGGVSLVFSLTYLVYRLVRSKIG